MIDIENPKDKMLARLFSEKGLEAKLILDEYVIFKNKEQIATIHKDRLHGRAVANFATTSPIVVYLSGFKDEAAEVLAIIQATNECFSAYENGVPLINNDVTSDLKDYKNLLSFGNHVLAAKIMPDVTFEFVTWKQDKKTESFDLGHYFSDFQTAKEDFAIRSGLFDKSKMFSETEMLVIRAGLIKCTALDPNIGNEMEKEMGAIIEKIDNVVTPEIEERKQEEVLQHEGDELEMGH